MSRITSAPERRKRKTKLFQKTKGYRLGKKNLYRHAVEQLEKSMVYATRDRKARTREFRSLWIMRINAAARTNGLSYSRFMDGLKKASIRVDRKMLAELAVSDAKAFSELSELAKKNLNVI